MTDKLHYPELFKTINIPEQEKHLALGAQHLFEIASGEKEWDPEAFGHMSRFIDTQSASQVFWDFENDDQHHYDRFVLTAMNNLLTFGIEHRDFDDRTVGYRKSMTLSQGFARVYMTDINGSGRFVGMPESEFTVEAFKRDFHATTIANLGLSRFIKRHSEDQNESSSAILANAA